MSNTQQPKATSICSKVTLIPDDNLYSVSNGSVSYQGRRKKKNSRTDQLIPYGIKDNKKRSLYVSLDVFSRVDVCHLSSGFLGSQMISVKFGKREGGVEYSDMKRRSDPQ